jgi:hypothetical protein
MNVTILRAIGAAVATISVVFGLWMAIPAFLYLTAVSYAGDNMPAFKLTGLMLLLLCISHCTPFTLFKSQRSVIIFAASSLLVALICGISYDAAEAHNLYYRTEDGFLADQPYKLAALACVCPSLKALIRSRILKAEKQKVADGAA